MFDGISAYARNRYEPQDKEPPPIDPSWKVRFLLNSVHVGRQGLSPQDQATARQILEEHIRRGVDDDTLTLIARGLVHLGQTKERSGLDCSGFVKHLSRENGTPIDDHITAGGPNGCTQMQRSFVEVEPAGAESGDFVFFDYKTDPEKTANHVGVLIVHADGSRSVLHMSDHGVKLSPLEHPDGRRTYWGGKNPSFSRNPGLSRAG